MLHNQEIQELANASVVIGGILKRSGEPQTIKGNLEIVREPQTRGLFEQCLLNTAQEKQRNRLVCNNNYEITNRLTERFAM